MNQKNEIKKKSINIYLFIYLILFLITLYIFLRFQKRNLKKDPENIKIKINNKTIILVKKELHEIEINDKKKENEEIIKKIKNITNKNSTNIKNMEVSGYFGRVGNILREISNAIRICEALQCEKIYFNIQDLWFLKNNINYLNMTIIPRGNINCGEINNICIKSGDIYNFFRYMNITNEIRLNPIKFEFLKNIPKIETNSNDLYIYIRSSDVFSEGIMSLTQPPLCFYKKILDNFNFSNVFIIAEDTKNPVINKLLNLYPNIIYKKDSLENDMAKIVYAKNLVGATSTFFTYLSKLNIDIQKLFIYKTPEFNTFDFKHLNEIYFNKINNSEIFILPSSDFYNNATKDLSFGKFSVKENVLLNDICNENFKYIKFL